MPDFIWIELLILATVAVVCGFYILDIDEDLKWRKQVDKWERERGRERDEIKARHKAKFDSRLEFLKGKFPEEVSADTRSARAIRIEKRIQRRLEKRRNRLATV